MVLDFWRFVIEVKKAKTGCWYASDKENNEKVIWFGLCALKKDGQKAYQIFVGPFLLMFGYCK